MGILLDGRLAAGIIRAGKLPVIRFGFERTVCRLGRIGRPFVDALGFVSGSCARVMLGHLALLDRAYPVLIPGPRAAKRSEPGPEAPKTLRAWPRGGATVAIVPDEPNLPELRLSDQERERGVALLRDAVVAGRLTLEEFGDRVGRAQVARTAADLAGLTADLPEHRQSPAVTTTGMSHRAVCSRLVRSGRWELPQRSSFRSYFGTINLDLRQATLDGEEVEVEVFNLFGTFTVLVPEGIEVSVEGGGLFASQVIEPPAGPPVPGSPKLRIRVSGPGGTIHIRGRDPDKPRWLGR